MIDTSIFYKKYYHKMGEDGSVNYMFDNYDAINLAKEEIYYRKHKLIDKVIKRIAKQIQKNPLQNWYLVDINEYSLKEMKYIKVFFEGQDFKIEFEEPKDNMYTYDYSAISAGVIGNTITLTCSKNPHTKFYIVWENK